MGYAWLIYMYERYSTSLVSLIVINECSAPYLTEANPGRHRDPVDTLHTRFA